MKKCCTCKEPKTLDSFSKNKRKKDGLQTKCKSCAKEYREENKEFIQVKQKEWYLKNKFK